MDKTNKKESVENDLSIIYASKRDYGCVPAFSDESNTVIDGLPDVQSVRVGAKFRFDDIVYIITSISTDKTLKNGVHVSVEEHVC